VLPVHVCQDSTIFPYAVYGKSPHGKPVYSVSLYLESTLSAVIGTLTCDVKSAPIYLAVKLYEACAWLVFEKKFVAAAN
jgi:hypothetical protein